MRQKIIIVYLLMLEVKASQNSKLVIVLKPMTVLMLNQHQSIKQSILTIAR